jgi:hypothetical protein
MQKFRISAFIVSAMIILSNYSCKKTEISFMNDAVITGFDVKTCICCGGVMITFNGVAQPYTGESRLIENGKDLGITAEDKFPIYVKVDWRTDATNVCNHIIITRIARK